MLCNCFDFEQLAHVEGIKARALYVETPKQVYFVCNLLFHHEKLYLILSNERTCLFFITIKSSLIVGYTHGLSKFDVTKNTDCVLVRIRASNRQDRKLR
jgi:hypothetical protein